MEEKIEAIIRFVDMLYHPKKHKVVVVKIRDRKVYTIGFYFEEIPDKYLSDLTVMDVKRNNLFLLAKKKKEHNLTNEIRTYIENYLGIKTSGFQQKNLWPEDHGITIVTQSEK